MTDQSSNPVVVFKRELTKMIETEDLSLPSNVSPDAFRNAALVAVQDNPKILGCDKASVFRAIRSLAGAGLVPDGREAALVPFKTKDGDRWIDKCQAMPMVAGLVKMVRRSGDVSDIRAHIVYQNELDQGLFTYVIGDSEKLEHTPILFGEKGPAVAAYAIAKLKDGTLVREFMDHEQLEAVRKAGSSQKIFRKGQKPEVSEEPIGIWHDWWSEMAKKSVIRRLCKRLDMSAEDRRRVIESESDYDGMRDVSPEPRPLTPLQRKVAAARGTPEEPMDGEVLPPEDERPHWTAAIDAGQGAPGSSAWDEGMTAFGAGQDAEDCPHEDDRNAAQDWLGGYAAARLEAGEDE